MVQPRRSYPDRLALADGARFKDLVFLPHRDGHPGHLHALHSLPDGRCVSVTRGGNNFGEPEAPYEMQDAEGQIHAPLTSSDVDRLLEAMSA